MAWIYLIGEDEATTRFKIGLTTAKDINTRMKKLQTGNSNELYLKKSFKTNTPFKLELMLHNHYQNKKIINEWYELNEVDINDFENVCEKYQKIIDSLSDNPFFKSC